MTTDTAPANAEGLPEYDDDKVLADLSTLQKQLDAAIGLHCNFRLSDAHDWKRAANIGAMLDTAMVFIDHMHRSLTAAAYPSSEARS